MQNFLTNYYQNAVKDVETSTINLEELRVALSGVKGIGGKRLDEIMGVIERHIV